MITKFGKVSFYYNKDGEAVFDLDGFEATPETTKDEITLRALRVIADEIFMCSNIAAFPPKEP